MPKIKTKSGAKKRFKVTGTGKVLYAHRGKRHGMIKRTKKQIRQLRGTVGAVQDRRRQHQEILAAQSADQPSAASARHAIFNRCANLSGDQPWPASSAA